MQYGIHTIEYPDFQQSSQSSRRYDYTGADQLLKRRDAIADLEASKLGALYDGDVKAGIEAGKKIRSLRASLAGIEPVRLESEGSEVSVRRDGGAVKGPPTARRDPDNKEDEGEMKPPPAAAAPVRVDGKPKPGKA